MSKQDKGTRKRRANGEGTVQSLPDGRFRAIAPPDKTGYRPKKTVRNRNEAARFLKEIEAKRKEGLKPGTLPTLGEFAAYWLDEEIKPTIRIKTYSSYAWILRTCLLLYMGGCLLSDITRQQIVKLYNTLREEGYARSTIKNASLRLNAILDAAVQNNLIPNNPAKGIKLPKPEPRKRDLSVAEIRAVIDATRHYHNGLIYEVFVNLGLRKGEGLGLRWGDWDRDEHTIRITQQVQEIDGKVIISEELKTEASARIIPLPARIEAKLYQQEKAQEEERAANNGEWSEHGLIFASERGTPVAPSNLNRQWGLLRNRVSIQPITIHELRHTFATRLGELGVEERVIGVLLGHVASNITAQYAHVTLAMKRKAVEALALLLGEVNQ